MLQETLHTENFFTLLLLLVLFFCGSGDLAAAEAGCAACLAAWPGCAKGHLKMAQILRAAGGVSEQVWFIFIVQVWHFFL